MLSEQKLEVTGTRQSPIDIQTTKTVSQRTKRDLSEESAGLKIDYSPLTGAQLSIENTGHGWKVNIPDELAQKCPITGGPLGSDEYRLLQIHCHWGKDLCSGSEHTVDGKTFPAELHLVHWNSTKYPSPAKAQDYTNDGLAVIGVFVTVNTDGEQANAQLEPVVAALASIPFKGDQVSLQSSQLDINQLVPDREEPKFYNYLGSLTTPPYSESVIWIVMSSSINANNQQLDQFRKMYEKDQSSGEKNHKVEENFRETQNLHDRTVVFFG